MMTGRGAFLAPALVSMPSSFVNLPRAFVQTFLGAPADAAAGGATILELSWETLDGYVQRVCVAWIGGLVKPNAPRTDAIEISAEFARCCGISELLEKAPQAFLGVHVVDALPIASHVNVEPCTPDDWELIQLHAGLLETEMLRQMCVVNDKQVTPIWVHHHVLIRVRASLPVGMEHARLSPNTEVIVAPNERKQQTNDDNESTLSPDFYYRASAPLIVQAASAICSIDASDEVWIHPETLARLDGAVDLENSSSHHQVPPVVAVWSLERSNNREPVAAPASPNETDASRPSNAVTATATTPTISVVRLKCSDNVVRGRVLLSAAVEATLDVAANARVQLRVLRLPEIAPLQLTLRVLVEPQQSIDDTNNDDDMQQAFANWLLERPDAGFVAHAGSMLQLTVDCDDESSDTRVCVMLDVRYDDDDTAGGRDSIAMQQLTDIPTGAIEQFTLLGGRNGFTLPRDCITIELAKDADARKLRAFAATTLIKNSSDGLYTSDAAVHQLAQSTAVFAAVQQAIRSVVYRDASVARVLLGTNTPGSVLVHGARGAGKSTLLHALERALRDDPHSAASSVVLDCRDLRGVKMETVTLRLRDAFDAAARQAPALVLLDNVDALVPEEDESAGPANDQARRIAELLATLLQSARARMSKATLTLQRAYCLEAAQLDAMDATTSSKAARRKTLLETLAHAIARKSVAVVATARSDASIHKSLRACGLFDRPIAVTSPDAERREVVIRKMLTMRIASAHTAGDALALDPTIDIGLLASLTEGYSLRDLASATDRALHKTITRYALRMNASIEPANKRLVTQTDFVDGLDGFQPSALIGVALFKSTVKWSDVGGLHDVRTVLKDTLELPTRYSKLYDNTPIKLPAGMLLYGPPGCGKTLLASAVAHECGLNFISVKGPEVLNKYIGASEQAIRDLFARAASAAPSVLFLDEFDSIAPRRGADNTGVTDRLVNQLLTFLDGVEGRKGVYVLAATSRPDMIDPALLRPGRLDKSLYCGFPTEDERLDILHAVGKDMELDDDALAYLPTIAASPKSANFSGADLQAIMYSAQLELVHEKLQPGGEHSSVIRQHHVQVAFESAKASTSQAARRDFDAMYASFSRARTTDFAVAGADASASLDKMQSPITHQRTALA